MRCRDRDAEADLLAIGFFVSLVFLSSGPKVRHTMKRVGLPASGSGLQRSPYPRPPDKSTSVAAASDEVAMEARRRRNAMEPDGFFSVLKGAKFDSPHSGVGFPRLI
jgi:hypothetical protein